MREILFRGKDAVNGEWITGFLVDEKHIGNFIVANPIIPETVGQYTGLYDEELEPIYEGDVVEYTHKDRTIRGQIVFEEGAFGIGKRGDPLSLDLLDSTHNDHFISLWELIYNSDCYEDTVDGLKVLGNIHDNPKLLEV